MEQTATFNIDPKTKRMAYILGLAGLIPFVGGAMLALTLDGAHSIALEGLIVYAALIITFIGALHWGRILSGTKGLSYNPLWLVWSIVPSLLAWVLIFMPPEIAVLAAIALLFTCLGVDVIAHKFGRIPSWMMRLRYILTCGASVSLFVAWISGLDNGPSTAHLIGSYF